MICKKCGAEIDDLSIICPECCLTIDIDEHEKFVDEKIASREIKKKSKKQKKNCVICEKCGANIDTSIGVCPNCTHILVGKGYKTTLLLSKYLTNANNTKNDIYNNNSGLIILCGFIPFLGIILRFTLKKSNYTLAKKCFDTWENSLPARFILISLFILLMSTIF